MAARSRWAASFHVLVLVQSCGFSFHAMAADPKADRAKAEALMKEIDEARATWKGQLAKRKKVEAAAKSPRALTPAELKDLQLLMNLPRGAPFPGQFKSEDELRSLLRGLYDRAVAADPKFAKALHDRAVFRWKEMPAPRPKTQGVVVFRELADREAQNAHLRTIVEELQQATALEEGHADWHEQIIELAQKLGDTSLAEKHQRTLVRALVRHLPSTATASAVADHEKVADLFFTIQDWDNAAIYSERLLKLIDSPKLAASDQTGFKKVRRANERRRSLALAALSRDADTEKAVLSGAVTAIELIDFRFDHATCDANACVTLAKRRLELSRKKKALEVADFTRPIEMLNKAIDQDNQSAAPRLERARVRHELRKLLKSMPAGINRDERLVEHAAVQVVKDLEAAKRLGDDGKDWNELAAAAAADHAAVKDTEDAKYAVSVVTAQVYAAQQVSEQIRIWNSAVAADPDNFALRERRYEAFRAYHERKLAQVFTPEFQLAETEKLIALMPPDYSSWANIYDDRAKLLKSQGRMAEYDIVLRNWKKYEQERSKLTERPKTPPLVDKPEEPVQTIDIFARLAALDDKIEKARSRSKSGISEQEHELLQQRIDLSIKADDPLGAIADLTLLIERAPEMKGKAPPPHWIFPSYHDADWSKLRDARAKLIAQRGALRLSIGDLAGDEDLAYAEVAGQPAVPNPMVSPGADPVQRRVARLKSTGQRSEESKQWNTALLEYDEAVRLAPHDSELAIKLQEMREISSLPSLYTAGDLMAAKKYAEAIPHYKKYLQFIPDSSPQQLDIANAYFYLKDQKNELVALDRGVALAEAEFAKAAEARQEIAKDWLTRHLTRRAYCHMGASYYDCAIEDFQRVITLNPRDASLHLRVGECHRILKQAEKAEAAFAKAIEISPEMAQQVDKLKEQPIPQFPYPPERYAATRYFNSGRQRCLDGEYAEAIQDLERAKKFVPNSHVIYAWNGLAHLELGDFKAADSELKHAIALDPKNADSREWYGRVLIARDDNAVAVEQLTKAIELEPKRASPYAWRSQAQMHLGKYMEADRDVSKAESLLKDPGVDDERLKIRLASHKIELAALRLDAEFETALAKIDAGEMTPAVFLRQVNENRRNVHRRELHIPDDAPAGDIQFLLAEALCLHAQKTSDPDKAAVWAQRAVDLGWGEAAVLLGNQAWAKGDLQNAKSWFTVAFNDHHSNFVTTVEWYTKPRAEGYLKWIAAIERRKGLEPSIPKPLELRPFKGPALAGSVWTISIEGEEAAAIEKDQATRGYLLNYDYSIFQGVQPAHGYWKPMPNGVRLTTGYEGHEVFEGTFHDENTLKGVFNTRLYGTSNANERIQKAFPWTGRRFVDRTIPDDPKAWKDVARLAGTKWEMIWLERENVYTRELSFDPSHRFVESGNKRDQSQNRWTSQSAKSVRFQFGQGAVVYDGVFADKDNLQGTTLDRGGETRRWIGRRITPGTPLSRSPPEDPPFASMKQMEEYSGLDRRVSQLMNRGGPKDFAEILAVANSVLKIRQVRSGYEQRCEIHLYMGNGKAALADADELVRRSPHDPTANKFRYFALTMLGRDQDAARLARKFLFADRAPAWKAEFAKFQSSDK